MPTKKGATIYVGTDQETPEDVVSRVTDILAKKFPNQSPAEALAGLPPLERAAWLGSLSENEQSQLEYSWDFWARPNQREPKIPYKVLILLAGRGFGKSRTAAETVRGWVESGKYKHVAMVGANAADVRDTMVEATFKQGSGLMQICPPWNKPHYSPTKKVLVWNNPNYPSYGAVCSLYSGDVPDSLRGPSHDGAWIDELCKMVQMEAVWDMLKLTLRRGDNPKIVVSTTPKPVPLLIDLLKQAQESKEDGTNDIVVIKGNTYENRANLSSSFIEDINQMYEGTTLGRQEIYADIMLDSAGALWNMAMIDNSRIRMNRDGIIHIPTCGKTIISVDPQIGYKIDTEKSRTATGRTMTGIIAAASSFPVRGQPLHAYILGDYSTNGKPEQWGQAAVNAYKAHDAQLLIAESNNGGEMIASVIRSIDPHVRVQLITATAKKHERAIPVVSKYQQCLAGDTLVSTEFGDVKISGIRTGDRVWTRNGLRAVLWAGQTGARNTIAISHGERTLVCTPDHEIFSGNKFSHAEDLDGTYATLTVWQSGIRSTSVGTVHASMQLRENPICAIPAEQGKCGKRDYQFTPTELLKESDILRMPKGTGVLEVGEISMEVGNCCTEEYGKRITVQFQQGIIFIISMVTRVIMLLIILFRCTQQITKLCMKDIHIPKKYWLEYVKQNVNGGNAASRLREYANGALATFLQKLQEFDSVRRNVTQVSGMTSVKKSVKMPVYNLHVENDHEFFANGILVHNCRVHHVGILPDLEFEQVNYEPGDEENKKSPNRMDALVWAVRHLLVDGVRAGAGISIARRI